MNLPPAGPSRLPEEAARLALEAKLQQAIMRARKNYQQVQRPAEQMPSKGPSHLGTKIDLWA